MKEIEESGWAVEKTIPKEKHLLGKERRTFENAKHNTKEKDRTNYTEI